MSWDSLKTTVIATTTAATTELAATEIATTTAASMEIAATQSATQSQPSGQEGAQQPSEANGEVDISALEDFMDSLSGQGKYADVNFTAERS